MSIHAADALMGIFGFIRVTDDEKQLDNPPSLDDDSGSLNEGMEMDENKYFTAVFEVSNHEEFIIFAKKVSAAMFGEPTFHGASVTGCGWGDSMTEADLAADFLNENGFDSGEIMRGARK